ncbi:hypothetical protein D3C81_1185830 [compost metagenome]
MPRLMGVWWQVLESLDLDCSFVIPLRNPLSVAASLAERDGFATSKSLLLWYEHMYRALMFAGTKRAVVVDYDHFLEYPRASLMRIAERLKLEFDEPSFLRFSNQVLDAGLCHSRFDELALQEHSDVFHALTELHGLLRQLANDQLSLESEAFLHRRGEVEKAFAAIWPLIHHCGRQDMQLWDLWQSSSAERAWFSKTRAELTARIEALEASVMAKEVAWRKERNRLQGRRSWLQGVLRSRQCAVRDMERQLLAAVTELDMLRRKLQELQMEIESTQDACAAAWRRVEAVLASSSWRITAPLRGIRRLFAGDRVIDDGADGC